jgi:hypothetical protein
MLIPENSMKKQASFLISCFFLASMMFFFSSGRVNLNEGVQFVLDEIPYINFDEQYSNAKRQSIALEMKTKLNTVLAADEIYPQEILTIVDISDKYRISINEIRLVFLKSESEPSETELDTLKKAIHIVQKEVGDDILITGEFKG